MRKMLKHAGTGLEGDSAQVWDEPKIKVEAQSQQLVLGGIMNRFPHLSPSSPKTLRPALLPDGIPHIHRF